jgi:hypothetical protein
VSNEGRRVTGERAGLADFGEWARPGSTRNIHFSKPFRSAPSQLTRQPNTSLVSKERRKTGIVCSSLVSPGVQQSYIQIMSLIISLFADHVI